MSPLPASLRNPVLSILHAGQILRLVRISVAFIVGAWTVFALDRTFYAAHADLLYEPGGLVWLVPPLSGSAFLALQCATVLGAIAMLFDRIASWATLGVAVSFFVLNGYVSAFAEIWNFNAHLNIFLIALAFAPGSRGSDRNGSSAIAFESSVLFFLRLQVALLYFQAGLTKLLSGGIFWAERTPYVNLVLRDGWLSPLLADSPGIVALLGNCVIVGEFLIFFMLLFRRTQVIAACCAIALHISFFLLLGIGFWHLILLYPALFFTFGRARDDGH